MKKSTLTISSNETSYMTGGILLHCTIYTVDTAVFTNLFSDIPLFNKRMLFSRHSEKLENVVSENEERLQNGSISKSMINARSDVSGNFLLGPRKQHTDFQFYSNNSLSSRNSSLFVSFGGKII